jgi:OFA family oxalate/formate antiporter-like MFS transporter
LSLTRRRWLVIAAGILANACCGAGYAFSVIKGPLMAVLGRSDPEVSLAYSLSVVFLPAGMLLAGAICARRGPRFAIALGGILFGAGMLLAGFSRSLVWLYATYGAMVSVGQGLSYGTVIATAVRWFPDRRGLASGLVVSALGVGTLVVAPLYQAIIGNDPTRVMLALKALGIAFVITVGTASRFITEPPKGYSPASTAEQAGRTRARGSEEEVEWRAMLARPLFWTLFALYVLGTFSGHMVLTQAAGIAQKITLLTATAASFVVGLLGIANAAGRLFWGGISDRIGRLTALASMFAITAAAMMFLPELALRQGGLIIGFALILLCYGGNLGLFPSLCADAFGGRNLAVNYALLFVAFGVAGVTGPRVGALMLQRTGSYSAGCAVAAAAAGLGLLISLGLRLQRRRSP